MAKRKSSKKNIKKEPICSKSIWHIAIGVLALAAIVAIIILAIPEDNNTHRIYPENVEEIVESQPDTTTEVQTPSSLTEEVVDKEKDTKTSSGGSSGGSSSSSSSDPDEPEEMWPKCANWFGNNLNWEEITVATQSGNSGPWGLMNNNECTEAIIGDQGVYACALTFEEGGYTSCAGDCKDGECLPCEGCNENVGEFSCADAIDNDGDGTLDCADDNCNAELCALNSYCNNGECVEEKCTYVDTDGGQDHLVQGTCDDGKAVIYTDNCQDENILVEYWLGEGEACYNGCQGGSTLFYCPSLGNGWGCSEGACVLAEGSCEFTDSDGGWNLEEQGTCDDGKAFLNTDECTGIRSITEYRLHPNEPCTEGCIPGSYICPVFCEEGACVEETTVPANGECSNYCKAQRGTNYESGVCIDYNEQGAISKESACINSDYLSYESGSEGKCHAESICCCAEEMVIV